MRPVRYCRAMRRICPWMWPLRKPDGRMKYQIRWRRTRFFWYLIRVFLLAESDAKPILLRRAPDRWAIPAVHAASDARGVDDAGLAPSGPGDQSRAVGGYFRLSHRADAAEPPRGDRAHRVFRGGALRAQQAQQ